MPEIDANWNFDYPIVEEIELGDMAQTEELRYFLRDMQLTMNSLIRNFGTARTDGDGDTPDPPDMPEPPRTNDPILIGNKVFTRPTPNVWLDTGIPIPATLSNLNIHGVMNENSNPLITFSTAGPALIAAGEQTVGATADPLNDGVFIGDLFDVSGFGISALAISSTNFVYATEGRFSEVLDLILHRTFIDPIDPSMEDDTMIKTLYEDSAAVTQAANAWRAITLTEALTADGDLRVSLRTETGYAHGAVYIPTDSLIVLAATTDASQRTPDDSMEIYSVGIGAINDRVNFSGNQWDHFSYLAVRKNANDTDNTKFDVFISVDNKNLRFKIDQITHRRVT